MLELLTVVAVTGILAAASVPAIRSFSESTDLRGVSKQLATDLWYARQKAIATSAFHSVVFDSDDNTYTIFVDDGGGNPANEGNGVLNGGEQIVRARHLGSNHVFSEIDLDPTDTIIFVPKGTLKIGTSGGTVTITDDDERSRAVTILASGLTRTS